MFTIDDEDQEEKRELWYRPLGEFIVLFSNLEFETQDWARLVCDSQAIYKSLISIWRFQKRVELIIELIGKGSAGSAWKKAAVTLWKETIPIANIRNIIAHNPLFENSKMELDESFTVKFFSSPVVGISKLSKPIGEPSADVTLEKLVEACSRLRRILI